MRKYIFLIIGVLFLAGAGYLAYYFFFMPKDNGLLPCNEGCVTDGDCLTGFCSDGFCRNDQCPDEEDCQCGGGVVDDVLVRQDFSEDFRDGEIDDFWTFNNGGLEENQYAVDYIKEELVLTAAGGTSQWTNDNTAPVLSFLTDKDFSVIVELDFDPRVDFQHAGIGVLEPISGDWARVSRSYDSHSLENPSDQPNSVYVMKKGKEGLLKLNHDNYRDVRVYLKMTRLDQDIAYEYSQDGEEWTLLDEVSLNTSFDELSVYLFAYSTNKTSIDAIYKNIDFEVY